MSILNRLMGRKSGKDQAVAEYGPFTLPGRQRVYAVGDVHGRLDLLDQLLGLIDADDASREPIETTLIFLGDLIDRGPDSRGVVERVMQLMQASPQVRCLTGNHEDLLLRVHGGDTRALTALERAGGVETLQSYGVDWDLNDEQTDEELIGMINTHIPPEHIGFLRGLDDYIVIGDYTFVHAGLKPGVPLRMQKQDDLRWIRDRFTSYAGDHGMMVIHGHSITEAVDVRPNRIGIDTGAYHTGKLTAIGLEGDDRWFIDTGGGVAGATGGV